MGRVILHSDLNNFYASVECLYNPKIRSFPVAVCGSRELRHGIVLAKNQIAKTRGIKTGETIGDAKQKCEELIIVEPRMELYNQFSKWAREIYEEYADNIESYGKDESWLEITNLVRDEYEGQSAADEIRAKIKKTLGITCSIGVSFNKTMSKLAGDLRKPDATTVISSAKFKEIVWPLSPDHLLGVDVKTNQMLRSAGITDIGNIAKTPVEIFEKALGKNGRTLHKYASGEEKSPVKHKDYAEPVKTIGHIHTTYRDMTTIEDIRREIYSLSERAAAEIREKHFKCRTIQINIRSNDLKWCDRQGTLETPSYIADDIAEKAMKVFMKQYNFSKPLRSIGVRLNGLVPDDTGIQSSLFDDDVLIQKREKAARAIDMLRGMYGYDIIRRANILEDKKLTDIPEDYSRFSYRVGSAFFKDA